MLLQQMTPPCLGRTGDGYLIMNWYRFDYYHMGDQVEDPPSPPEKVIDLEEQEY